MDEIWNDFSHRLGSDCFDGDGSGFIFTLFTYVQHVDLVLGLVLKLDPVLSPVLGQV